MIGLETVSLGFIVYLLLKIANYSLIFLVLVFVVKNRDRLLEKAMSMRKYLVVLCIIFLVGLLLRSFVAEPTLLHENRHPYGFFSKAIDKAPVFLPTDWYPLGTVFVFRLFRDYLLMDPSNFFHINVLLGSLSIIAIFFASNSIFKNKDIALMSSLILALLPIHIKYSNSDVLEISSILFLLLFIGVFFWMFDINRVTKRKEYLEAAICALLLVISIQMRPDDVATLAIAAICLLVYIWKILSSSEPHARSDRIHKILLFSILVIILLIPWLIYLYQLSAIRVTYFGLRLFSSFYPGGYRYLSLISPLIIMISAIAIVLGAILMMIKHRTALLSFVAFFIVRFAIITSAPAQASNYQYGELRYHLIYIAPLIIIASYGLYSLINLLYRVLARFQSERVIRIYPVKTVLLSLMIPLMVAVLLSGVPFIRSDQNNLQSLEFLYLKDHLLLINNSNVFVMPVTPQYTYIATQESLNYLSYFSNFRVMPLDKGPIQKSNASSFFYLNVGCVMPGPLDEFSTTLILDNEILTNVSRSCAESISALGPVTSYLQTYRFTPFYGIADSILFDHTTFGFLEFNTAFRES